MPRATKSDCQAAPSRPRPPRPRRNGDLVVMPKATDPPERLAVVQECIEQAVRMPDALDARIPRRYPSVRNASAVAPTTLVTRQRRQPLDLLIPKAANTANVNKRPVRSFASSRSDFRNTEPFSVRSQSAVASFTLTCRQWNQLNDVALQTFPAPPSSSNPLVVSFGTKRSTHPSHIAGTPGTRERGAGASRRELTTILTTTMTTVGLPDTSADTT
jgi:hypothetical protein